MVHQFGVISSNIFHESRTAGSCFPFLFFNGMGKFFCFRQSNHIACDGSFYYFIETQLLDTCKHLAHCYTAELAGNGRRHYCIYMVLCVIYRIFQQIQHIHHIRLIYDCAERTLIYTGTTGNTFFVVNHCFFVFVHFYCIYRAGTHTGAHNFSDSTKGTNLFTFAAFNTQILIDMGSVVYDGDSALRAYFLTFMAQTATTGVTDCKTVNRAFITSRIQHIDYAVIFRRFDDQTHAVFHNVAFFIYTATIRCLLTGHDGFCDISFLQRAFCQCAVEEAFCYFFVYQIFDVLYITFKIFHIQTPQKFTLS